MFRECPQGFFNFLFFLKDFGEASFGRGFVTFLLLPNGRFDFQFKLMFLLIDGFLLFFDFTAGDTEILLHHAIGLLDVFTAAEFSERLLEADPAELLHGVVVLGK